MMGQATFEARHSEEWAAFESWLSARERLRRAEAGMTPAAALPDDDVPAAYRALCQHLALARDRQYSPDLVDRLNQLVLRGHHVLYGARGSGTAGAAEFLLRGFPRLVRQEWRLVLARLPAVLRPDAAGVRGAARVSRPGVLPHRPARSGEDGVDVQPGQQAPGHARRR